MLVCGVLCAVCSVQYVIVQSYPFLLLSLRAANLALPLNLEELSALQRGTRGDSNIALVPDAMDTTRRQQKMVSHTLLSDFLSLFFSPSSYFHFIGQMALKLLET